MWQDLAAVFSRTKKKYVVVSDISQWCYCGQELHLKNALSCAIVTWKAFFHLFPKIVLPFGVHSERTGGN